MNHRTPAHLSLLLATALTTIPTPAPAPIMREFYRSLDSAAEIDLKREELRLMREGIQPRYRDRRATEEQHRADDLETLLKKQARDYEIQHLRQLEQIQSLEQELRRQR